MAITTNKRVIAAICGNFWQESTVNPGIWENLTIGAPGFGLGQWTDNSEVSRRTALFNYLDSHSYSRDSGPGQLEFLVYENSWLGNGAGYQSAYSSLTDFFNSTSTNLDDLTLEFFHQWEGIDDGTGQIRIDAAWDFYDLFVNDDGTRHSWYASNSYNSQYQANWNALNILDYMLGTTPPTPPGPIPPHQRKRMPLWLMYKITERS